MGTFIAEKNEFLEDKGALYSYEKSKGVIQHQKPIGLSNGLTWEMNAKKFYYIDSLQYCVFGFDYDPENGTIGNIILNIFTD
jgi:pyruvate kinase